MLDLFHLIRQFDSFDLFSFIYFCNIQSEDATRKFVISVFLEDDSISISEPPVRNSGHKGLNFTDLYKNKMHANKVVQDLTNCVQIK